MGDPLAMNHYIQPLTGLDKGSVAVAGGKGANLGELTRIAGLLVPPGFCVTTRAYRKFISSSHELSRLLDALDSLKADAVEALQQLGEQIRTHLLSLPMPEEISAEILQAWQETGSHEAYAVRSSATAEDLPGASFAGQQDTFLNMRGPEQLLNAVLHCWASLFTDRAIVYRRQNGYSHRKVQLAVVIQQMIFSEVSGIMFTADPVSGNRRITSIDAGFGLGEALVSGQVSADLYQVKNEKLIRKQLSVKNLCIKARAEGGTEKADLLEKKAVSPALSDEQALQLARLGKKIEQHFGSPQDIEWAIAEGQIFILQSRPITTLYPQPRIHDEKVHLFISIGHPQMMTDAMKPLGVSVLRTLVPLGKPVPTGECSYLQELGGRLYGDITPLLGYRQIRKRLPHILPALDESISRSVEAFIEREEFQDALGPEKKVSRPMIRTALPIVLNFVARILYRNNDQTLEEMNRYIASHVQQNRLRLSSLSGGDRIAAIQEMLSRLMPDFLPRVARILPPAIGSYFLIRNLARAWLGDESGLTDISKSPPGNITTEMGLELGDLADSLRTCPQVVDYLKTARDESFFQDLEKVPGGPAVLPGFQRFFERYGMRGTGEIDLTRPRWYENPTQIVPILINHIDGHGPGQHRQDFARGQEEAEKAARHLLERLRRRPRGYFKVLTMRRLLKVHRALIGIREHPKYYIVQNLYFIKQALLEEADRLVERGALADREDIFWFSLQEIKEITAQQQVDAGLIAQRKEKYELDQKRRPPRAMTSEGEIIQGQALANLPPGALAGSPVSAGTVQGRARVVLRLAEARMEPGDILVAPYTDPSWTPLFSLAAGLVTEVGGLMTHGSVVAREYGIPAVVGVDDATRKIKDGQPILIDGTRGFVTLL